MFFVDFFDKTEIQEQRALKLVVSGVGASDHQHAQKLLYFSGPAHRKAYMQLEASQIPCT